MSCTFTPKPLCWKGEPDLGGWYTEEELEAARKAIMDSMAWANGTPGRYKREFEDAFASYSGARHAIAFNGAGTALDMAIRCLDPEPGDEVISCAINFHGTHLAVLGGNARLVLCEPQLSTLNLDPANAERHLTGQTRAILVTHMNGLPADINEIEDLAARFPHPKHGPPKIIFDAARACGATYRGENIGHRGWMTIFSFQRKKLMSTLGEGGMIATNDSRLAERLRRLRAFGDGVMWGSNYNLTDVQAAVGLVQLRRLDAMNAVRIQRARQRSMLLEDIPELTLPPDPHDRSHLYYLYTLLVPVLWAGNKRNRLIEILRNEYGIGSVVANPPTYWTNAFIKEKIGQPRFPVAEQLGKRIVCPTLHPLMSDEDNRYIASALRTAVDRIKTQEDR